MAIDFTLSPAQRALQLQSRKFAAEVLTGAGKAELLATPEERFLATKPTYEAMVAAGYLRKCIPAPAGGDNAGLVDMAILAEEFYAVNPSVTLTMLGTVLGLLPILLGGTAEQCARLLAPFLKTSGAPLAGFCSSEPGGSANAAAPPPGEGVRTTARRDSANWIIDGRKKWVSSATGWDRNGADVLCVVCRTNPAAPPEQGVSIIAVEGPVPGIVFERAIDSIGHRAHLVPEFSLQAVTAPHGNLLGQEGGGLMLASAAFTGTAALVGIFGVALMRAAFDFALHFARTEKRGGVQAIIEHQAVGYALADAKITIEAARYLSWRACHALDAQLPGADELAVQAKIFGSEAAVRVITDLMRVVGIDSYDHAAPFGRLLQDALALPIFDGGNMGIRRRQLHAMLMRSDYDPLTACGGA
ncbi:acyl-CoA dehydrogenase family protein [Bradyrhizobium sp. 1(2017)]|uniref:acyl-CoA dehydrogenase family protein n=1 Tax=Bradyrhizobium sp. 1(2017) TaxID=1404888 RepID=UPI00140F36D2|nr:acyl-CoA dehydrogenase family protein [Bradyrhizobium sp. 1(2017)]QIO31278.1 acyl-CoA dehydrogenase family protein [Bradyrhizobium sp. 1(2017)]